MKKKKNENNHYREIRHEKKLYYIILDIERIILE